MSLLLPHTLQKIIASHSSSVGMSDSLGSFGILPPEIRDKVYGHIFLPRYLIFDRRYAREWTESPTLAILRVSKAIYHAALKILFSESTFHLHFVWDEKHFLIHEIKPPMIGRELLDIDVDTFHKMKNVALTVEINSYNFDFNASHKVTDFEISTFRWLRQRYGDQSPLRNHMTITLIDMEHDVSEWIAGYAKQLVSSSCHSKTVELVVRQGWPESLPDWASASHMESDCDFALDYIMAYLEPTLGMCGVVGEFRILQAQFVEKMVTFRRNKMLGVRAREAHCHS
ncbi:uncharacterized protein KY384_003531 [Bacidia gigantensis]|uniref:uncharacterized protein n=1 Tax=Bacidia gigantensis TaxID=2732470 RepID=UPI001D038920|nr:uncharacterized protein KY384_003531 [Bacidia gigantensis]KAG8531895.1 hypothetical protein KY384_003531 [Bacidia gigantensis]